MNAKTNSDLHESGRQSTLVFLLAASLLAVVPLSAVGAELEEIVVTANKREQSAQSIAVSVSAVSGEELAARGVAEFFDYAVSIPNLSFGATSDGVLSGRSISLRGIQGLNTTGVYIDDTPITETIDPRILDLERIEVLRGPTGTLYGGRSLGGTIRQITRKADPKEQYGDLRFGLSSTDESGDLNYIASGNINIPLSSTAAMKLSGFYERKGGVFDRAVGSIPDHLGAPATLAGAPSLINRDVDDETTVAFQAAFIFQPSDTLSIEPRIMYQKVELDGFPLADIQSDNFCPEPRFQYARRR